MNIRRAVRNIKSKEECDRKIRSKKLKIRRLKGQINQEIDIINEILIRKRQITNNSQTTFLDGFDIADEYKGLI